MHRNTLAQGPLAKYFGAPKIVHIAPEARKKKKLAGICEVLGFCRKARIEKDAGAP